MPTRSDDALTARAYLDHLMVLGHHQPMAILPGFMHPKPFAALAFEVAAAVARPASERALAGKPGAVAVIPIRGVIQPHLDEWELLGFAVSTDTIGRRVRAAVADPDVKAVVLAIDSPGGFVAGVPELAAEIRALRGAKPIVAQADHLMASAAYWIAAQADQVIASPSALVGSIGALAMHVEFSKMLEADGIKATIIAAGKHKADGNDIEPLSEGARAGIQGLVDDAYTRFVADVAKGRGVTAKAVRAGYGEGAVLAAGVALEAGLVDKVRSLADTLAALGVGPAAPGPVGRQPPRALAARRRDRELQFLAGQV